MSPPKAKPKTIVPPKVFPTDRTPRTVVPDISSSIQLHPVFSFRYADRENRGDWVWPTGTETDRFMNFLCDMNRSTWGQIRTQEYGNEGKRHRKHHGQPFDSVCNSAQKLISTLKLDEIFDELFRFRLDSRTRLWGFESSGVFYVLWWDANHKVCPTEVS